MGGVGEKVRTHNHRDKETERRRDKEKQRDGEKERDREAYNKPISLNPSPAV